MRDPAITYSTDVSHCLDISNSAYSENACRLSVSTPREATRLRSLHQAGSAAQTPEEKQALLRWCRKTWFAFCIRGLSPARIPRTHPLVTTLQYLGAIASRRPVPPLSASTSDTAGGLWACGPRFAGNRSGYTMAQQVIYSASPQLVVARFQGTSARDSRFDKAN